LLLSAEAEQCIEDPLLWFEAEETKGGAELADRWIDRLEIALDTLHQEDLQRLGLPP
jgi:hypothetical protein